MTILSRGYGKLSAGDAHVLSLWMDDMQISSEQDFIRCKKSAEEKAGGPVRLVGHTFGDLDEAPAYIFEPAEPAGP